jgi:hypothetical protein
MKKIWLIAFYFNLSLVLYTKEAFSFVTSEKLQTDYFTLGFYESKDKWSFGAFLSSGNLFKNFSFSAAGGNLSLSGSASKLNNPSLSSSITPFSSPDTKAQNLSISFSSSSFSKPLSYFLEASYIRQIEKIVPGRTKKRKKEKDSLSFKTNIFYSPDDKILSSSAYFDYSSHKKISYSLSLTSSLTGYERYKEDSWFMEKRYYGPGTMFSLGMQNRFKIKNLNSLLTINYYKSPLQTDDFTFSFENTFLINHLNLNLSLFYVPYDLITSSQKKISEGFQIKSGFQYSFLKGIKKRGEVSPLLIKSGLNIYFKKDDFYYAKASSGLSFTGEKNNLVISTTLIMEEDKKHEFDLSSLTLSIKDSFIIGKIKINFGGTVNYDFFDSLMTEKISLSFNLNLKNKLTFNLNSGFSLKLTQKDFSYKKDEKEFYLSCKAAWKYINLTGKISFNY